MINIEQIGNVLKISYFNEEGEISIVEQEIPKNELYTWDHTSKKYADTTYKSWTKNNPHVRKRKITNPFDKYSNLNSFRLEELFIDHPDMLDGVFVNNKPNKCFIDIETWITGKAIDAEKADGAIMSISIAKGNNIYTFGFKELTSNEIDEISKKLDEYFEKFKAKINFTYVKFYNEESMLTKFFSKKFMSKMPLLTGWNFVRFDWTYLVSRANQLGVDTTQSSPSNILTGKDRIPMHRPVVDYLEIYKKWDRTVKLKERNTLDFVSNQVLGLSKVKFNMSLNDLYERDFVTYIFYNAVDAYLLKLIDDKIDTYSTFANLASTTKVELLKAFSPVRMTEALYTRGLYHKKMVHVVNKEDRSKKEKFSGAYVMNPVPGLYRWIVGNDYQSLYPTIMRMWNISPENYLGKYDSTYDYDTPITHTISGATFDNKEESVFNKMLTDLFNQRVQSKKMMQELNLEIEELKKFL